jgi:DNA-binding CsgD family transcriptional regulator
VRSRTEVLRASVTILLEDGDRAAARGAADDLTRIAAEIDATFLHAAAAAASGAVALAEGDAEAARLALQRAAGLWQELDAPYEIATTRALLGAAYELAGDDEGARMEFEAAHELFERLGAAPDAVRMADRLARWTRRPTSGLTGREVEVLRLVATGRTNRAIATALAISEKTVARHLSNIFTKLDLSSRSAATAYAYEHHLV